VKVKKDEEVKKNSGNVVPDMTPIWKLVDNLETSRKKD
jgi:hypothetical protein